VEEDKPDFLVVSEHHFLELLARHRLHQRRRLSRRQGVILALLERMCGEERLELVLFEFTFMLDILRRIRGGHNH